MNVQIENYNEGVVIKNDFVYFHFSHELNDVTNGSALFYFKNNELKNVMFTIFYEEIVDYFFSNRKYGNYLDLKATSENPVEKMIEIKLPRSRVSLNHDQASFFKEILSVFEDVVNDKVLLQANKKRLEMMSFESIAKSKIDKEFDDINIWTTKEKIILFLEKLYFQVKFLNYKYLLLIVLRMLCIYILILIIMSVIPENLEKRKQALANNTPIFQKCEMCGFTAKIQ